MITLFLGRAGQFLLMLITMRVATSLLSPQEMGRVSLVLTTTAFYVLFLVNPVGMFINRRLHAWQASGVAVNYLTWYGAYLLLIALIAALSLPMLVISGVVSTAIPLLWLIFLVCASILFTTLNQTAIPSLNLMGYNLWFVWLSLASTGASLVFASYLAWMVAPLAQYWVLGLLIGQTLLAGVGVWVVVHQLRNVSRSGFRPRIKVNQLRGLFDYAWPVALAAGLAWVQGQGYRYLIEDQLGLAKLGMFVAGYGVSLGLIAGFESVLTAYFQPRLYQNANSDQAELRAKAWRAYASALIPALLLTMVLVIVLAPELGRLFLGQDFQTAVDFVIWGALAETGRSLMGVYSLIAHVQMRTRWLIIPNLIGATSSMVLCVAMIPIFDLQGIGLALTLASYSVVLVLYWNLGRPVGGGIALHSLVEVIFYAMILWLIALIVRSTWGDVNWVTIFINVVVVGVAYFYMQFRLLKPHLRLKVGS